MARRRFSWRSILSTSRGKECEVMGKILMRRIYEEKKENETRILVERLWPRGVSKEKAELSH
ncbi:MAG: DUF488 family protein [Clostridia bacterium]|nr:DUF488 family protein [Clostridia bacterium]